MASNIRLQRTMASRCSPLAAEPARSTLEDLSLTV